MKKILIAEDDKKIGTALEIRLKAAGYEVQVLRDGFRSYMRAMTDQPDLIVMDICMPMGSGLAVAQELKYTGLANVPIIFITASKKIEFWKMAQEVGAAGFFEKPFNMEKLLTGIARALHSEPSTNIGITV